MDREKFEEYERIRRSGLTNMLNIKNVVSLSNGKLNHKDIFDIISWYSKYSEEYYGKRI